MKKLADYPDFAELSGKRNRLKEQLTAVDGRVSKLSADKIYGDDKSPEWQHAWNKTEAEKRDLETAIDFANAQLEGLRVRYSRAILEEARPEYVQLLVRLRDALVVFQAAIADHEQWRKDREADRLDLSTLAILPPFPATDNYLNSIAKILASMNEAEAPRRAAAGGK